VFESLSASSTWEKQELALSAMLVVIVYTIIHNVLAAASTPFGYDEILTIIVSRQPGIPAMWSALSRGVDGQPLVYYVVERFVALIVPNEQIAYRLPSIIGLAVALWCVFVFIRRRDGAWLALTCSCVLVLTPLNTEHAVSARPYDLVVACIAIALVCYQRAEKWAWAVGMALSLTVAEGLHYFALFAFVPFAVAEMAFALRKRVVRGQVWIALACGFGPLAVCWPLLQAMKRTYGPHVWDPPSLDTAMHAYGGSGSAAIVLLLAFAMAATFLRAPLPTSAADDYGHQDLLAAALLVLPLLGLVATKVAHSGYSGRYFLSTALGVPLAGAYLFRLIGRRRIALFLAGAILIAGIAKKEATFWRRRSGHCAEFMNPANSIQPLLNSADHENLLIVVSDGLDYLPLAYYAAPALAKRIVAVVDVPKAIVYAHSDGIDRGLALVASCYPLGVYRFGDFASEHPQFLLYSSGPSVWDWWPQRLADDGYSLQVVATAGVSRVYLVTQSQPTPRK
jgi:hypothetical protein